MISNFQGSSCSRRQEVAGAGGTEEEGKGGQSVGTVRKECMSNTVLEWTVSHVIFMIDCPESMTLLVDYRTLPVPQVIFMILPCSVGFCRARLLIVEGCRRWTY